MNWPAIGWCAVGLFGGYVGGITTATVMIYNMPPPVHDVAWYQAHPSERSTTVAGCNNNPGEGMRDPNCVNATTADNKESLNSFIERGKKSVGW